MKSIAEMEIVPRKRIDSLESALGMLLWFVVGALWFGPLAGHVVNIYTCSVWPSERIETGLSADQWGQR